MRSNGVFELIVSDEIIILSFFYQSTFTDGCLSSKRYINDLISEPELKIETNINKEAVKELDIEAKLKILGTSINRCK